MLTCDLDAGYFRFSVFIKTNPEARRIEIENADETFEVFEPFGRSASKQSADSGDVNLYTNHNLQAEHKFVRIMPDHAPVWLQSRPRSLSTHAQQTVTISGAWVPVSLTNSSAKETAIAVVTHDSKNLWLQVTVDGRTGWIHGYNNFRIVGLGAD
jgi:hypothetical protein